MISQEVGDWEIAQLSQGGPPDADGNAPGGMSTNHGETWFRSRKSENDPDGRLIPAGRWIRWEGMQVDLVRFLRFADPYAGQQGGGA